MKRTLSRRAATLVIGAAVVFACVAFTQRCPGADAAEDAGGVKAGVDRVVILAAKTYLTGELTGTMAKEGDAATVAWSKVSGPGTVTFAAASAPVTTATFSATGDYVALPISPRIVRSGRQPG